LTKPPKSKSRPVDMLECNSLLAEACAKALRHFKALDEANAAIHCAEVRYSPITFRLAEALDAHVEEFYGGDALVYKERNVVMLHAGKYKEDPGRE